MTTEEILKERVEYKYGFRTEIESLVFDKGLSEKVIQRISAIKEEPEFMLQFRLKAYKKFLEMCEVLRTVSQSVYV